MEYNVVHDIPDSQFFLTFDLVTLDTRQSLLGHVELVTHANSGIGHTSF